MMNESSTPDLPRPWLRRYALLLMVATFPLIASGGTVTSAGVGMVDPTWTFSPFKLLTPQGFMETAAKGIGWVIEHGHRQIGYLVGMMAILLAIWTAVAQRSLAGKLLGLWVLLAVGSQGMLGAARIWTHGTTGFVSPDMGRDIAMLHGVTGQLVLVLMAVTASMLGSKPTPAPASPQETRVRRLALLTTWLMAAQLVLGVFLRHLGGLASLGLHVVLGLGVATHIVLLFVRSRELSSAGIRHLTAWMMGLLILQLLLGTAAWWVGGGSGMIYLTEKLTNERIVLTTAHQFVGALLLMLSAVTAYQAARQYQTATQPAATDLPLHAAGVGA